MSTRENIRLIARTPLNFDFSKCTLIQNKFGISFRPPKLMFDREKNDYNHFWGLYIFMSTSL